MVVMSEMAEQTQRRMKPEEGPQVDSPDVPRRPHSTSPVKEEHGLLHMGK
jgi:hypothetical protein